MAELHPRGENSVLSKWTVLSVPESHGDFSALYLGWTGFPSDAASEGCSSDVDCELQWMLKSADRDGGASFLKVRGQGSLQTVFWSCPLSETPLYYKHPRRPQGKKKHQMRGDGGLSPLPLKIPQGHTQKGLTGSLAIS